VSRAPAAGRAAREARAALPHVLGVLLLALLVRGVYLAQIAPNPFFQYPIVDAQVYDEMASAIVRGQDPYPGRAFFQPPLYPYFLSVLYRLAGRHLAVIRGLQFLLGAGNALLTYALARRLFGARVGLGAGLLFAIYGTMLFYEGELLPPVLLVTLDLLLLLAALSFLARPTPARAAGVGGLLGAASLTMAVVLPYAVVLAGGAACRLWQEHGLRRAALLRLAAAFVTGLAVVIAPVTIRNWRAGHEFVPISTNAGVNLYLGTGRNFDQKVAIRPGYEWKALAAEAAGAGYASPKAMSAYFTRKAVALVRVDPAGAGRTFARKLFLLAHGNEIPRNQAIYPFRGYSWLLSVLLWKHGIAFPWGILFPCAVLGAWLAVRQRVPRTWVPLAFALAHLAVIACFFVAARYRLNVVPVVVIFAVYGVLQLSERWRAGRWRALAGPALALAVLLLISNWRVGAMASTFDADAYYDLGTRYMQEGRPEARAMLEKALAVDPNYADANGNLGVLWLQAGDLQRARDCFEKVLRQYPNDVGATIEMGIVLAREGDVAGAKARFLKALQLDPHSDIARENLQRLENLRP
jgi:tetratricopeptide (TPR) repeat protein